MRYRWQLGFWAFLLMRVSAVAITFYLLLHIAVLSYLLKGPTVFDELMKTVQSRLFKFFELALLGGSSSMLLMVYGSYGSTSLPRLNTKKPGFGPCCL